MSLVEVVLGAIAVALVIAAIWWTLVRLAERLD